MDLAERAKIKQEIVRDTGYKTTTSKKVYCSDKYSTIYNLNNRLILKTNILGEYIEYELSGHPYEPVIMLKCALNEDKSFSIHGESYFPSNDDKTEWESFAMCLNGRVLLNQYERTKDTYNPQPNQMVAIKHSNSWYLCISDEKNILNISGWFTKNTIIYLLANKEQKLYFTNYKYANDEKERYIHIHYRKLSDIPNKCLGNLFAYKDKLYEIREWREGIEVRNVEDEEDTKCIYGIDIETSPKVSSLNGKVYNSEELFVILTKMFDDNTTNCVPYIK